MAAEEFVAELERKLRLAEQEVIELRREREDLGTVLGRELLAAQQVPQPGIHAEMAMDKSTFWLTCPGCGKSGVFTGLHCGVMGLVSEKTFKSYVEHYERARRELDDLQKRIETDGAADVRVVQLTAEVDRLREALASWERWSMERPRDEYGY